MEYVQPSHIRLASRGTPLRSKIHWSQHQMQIMKVEPKNIFQKVSLNFVSLNNFFKLQNPSIAKYISQIIPTVNNPRSGLSDHNNEMLKKIGSRSQIHFLCQFLKSNFCCHIKMMAKISNNTNQMMGSEISKFMDSLLPKWNKG